MKKLTVILIAALVVLGSGCTPEQLKAIESYYNIDLAPDAEAFALAQPDQVVTMQDGTTFQLNGDITHEEGLPKALSYAQFGVCDSWRPVYDWFVTQVKRPPTWAWFKKVLRRESGCGVDTYNEATGDSGPLQINPVHKHWIKQELGYDFVQIRQWLPGLEAAVALWNKTGKCNWTLPNFCS